MPCMTWLIPPKSERRGNGTFEVPDKLQLATANSAGSLPLQQLAADLRRVGCRAHLSHRMDQAPLAARRDATIAHPDGYRISITPDQVLIAARTAAGEYYAIQSLRDYLHQHGRTWPCIEINDAPDLARRAVYLDCSRGKVPTCKTLMALFERLARWKVNEVQLYIENVFTFSRHPTIGEGFSPFTPDDIRALEHHAGQHHMQLVPSLASLGHMEKVLMLPAYQALGELPGYRDWPGGTTLNPLDPRSIALIRDLYDEFLPLFKAQDFNACGDEPWELGQGHCQAAAAAQGVGTIYRDHVVRLYELAQAHGKRMNLWGDIVLKYPAIIPSLPSDLVMLNWDYEPDGPRMARTGEFANAGNPFLCCPGTHGWQSHGTRLSTAMRNIHQFAHVAHELGAEGLLNTDWGDFGHRNTLGVSLLPLAYGAACSWNMKATPAPESETFITRFTDYHFHDRSGAWAALLQAIGDDRYGYWAYHALVEDWHQGQALGDITVRGRPTIDEVELPDDDTLNDLIERAHAFDAMQPPASTALPAFEQVTLTEYALANQMNRIAAERVRDARLHRAGQRLSAAIYRRQRTALADMRDQLAYVWRLRNRPSRWGANRAALEAAIASTTAAP